MSELVDEILEQARTGVYRQELLDSIDAPGKEITKAIAQARLRGLYSLGDMRDMELGTYYQYDPAEPGEYKR